MKGGTFCSWLTSEPPVPAESLEPRGSPIIFAELMSDFYLKPERGGNARGTWEKVKGSSRRQLDAPVPMGNVLLLARAAVTQAAVCSSGVLWGFGKKTSLFS